MLSSWWNPSQFRCCLYSTFWCNGQDPARCFHKHWEQRSWSAESVWSCIVTPHVHTHTSTHPPTNCKTLLSGTLVFQLPGSASDFGWWSLQKSIVSDSLHVQYLLSVVLCLHATGPHTISVYFLLPPSLKYSAMCTMKVEGKWNVQCVQTPLGRANLLKSSLN